MSRNDFDVLDMVGISKKWTEPPLRTLIESIPAARGVFPDVLRAHQNLFLSTKKSNEPSPEVVAIRAEQSLLDVRYDDLLQGGYWLLTGLSQLSPDALQRSEYLLLRDTLYPNGISGARLSYSREGSAATLLEGKLTGENRGLLKNIPLPRGLVSEAHMLSVVEEQIDKGKRIGVLEDQKIQRQQEPESSTVAAPNASEVRRAWLNAARALETVLHLSSVDAAQRDLILAPLLRVEEIYEKRAKKADPTDTTA